jgi:CBS domain-containing protein
MENEANHTERKFVRDLMTVGVATCPPDTPIVDVIRLMLDKGFEAVVVLDRDDGHALGVLSQDEIVKAYGREDVRSLKAEDVMREGVPQIPPDVPLAAAAQMMRDQGVRAFFLMHHAGGIEYPAAMISYKHLLRHLAARSDEDLRDLGLAAARKAPLDAFIEKRDAARRQAKKR